MQRPYLPDADVRRARDAYAAAVQHAQIHPGLFGHPRRLEAAPLERDRCALHAPLERVRASSPLNPVSRELEQPVDHAGTSPPIRASSRRTCGAPSVTGRGYCPPLPQPPPIWFQRKSPAMWSMRSSVWNRLPASTTSFTSSATRSEEHTSELQSPCNLVCRLLLEKKKKTTIYTTH